MTTLPLEAAALAVERLTGEATRGGLRWKLVYSAERGEPHAFRLVDDDGAAVEPAQVIGETEDDARACVQMAVRLAPKFRARRKGLHT